jgi:hypothetical protein
VRPFDYKKYIVMRSQFDQIAVRVPPEKGLQAMEDMIRDGWRILENGITGERRKSFRIVADRVVRRDAT